MTDWQAHEPIPSARKNRTLGVDNKELLRAVTLLVLTILSTWLMYAWNPGGPAAGLAQGAAYAGSLLTILMCHEMGHYVTARRYGVRVSPPYFIPMPISPFGTMGAIIKMRDRIRNRRVLFDIGIAGPLAGIPPALAASIWGVANSRVVDVGPLEANSYQLGSSLIFAWVIDLHFPGLGPQEDVLLHPVAFAGWAGLFVTAFNLLPIGQLDGGHVVYGLLGKRSRYVSWGVLLALLGAGFFYPGWWVLVALLLVLRIRHPETADESIPLDPRRKALGVFALAFFVASFIPEPIRIP